MRFANERRLEFAGYDAQTRVARVLRDLAVAYGDREGNRVLLGWQLTQTELASLAAVAEPTVQKALRALREAKVIATGYRTLAVEDFAELDRIAGLLFLFVSLAVHSRTALITETRGTLRNDQLQQA
jgi:hypothetical protein